MRATKWIERPQAMRTRCVICGAEHTSCFVARDRREASAGVWICEAMECMERGLAEMFKHGARELGRREEV
jgi:hypothetical protein